MGEGLRRFNEGLDRPAFARVGLAAYVTLTLACLTVALSRDPAPAYQPPSGSTTDLQLYGRIVGRVRAGEGYYTAAGDLLRTLGYPTRSVFNWRLPTYAWCFSSLPDDLSARVLLSCGVLLGVGLTSSQILRESGIVPAGVAGVFLVGSMAWCTGHETYLFTELWAGTLILLSLESLRRGRTATGVAFGLAALLFRELALPYVCVCLAVALSRRRWHESIGWVVALAVFAAFLGWHGVRVTTGLTASDEPMPGGWVRFGGLRFVLTTSRTNIFLSEWPLWVTAVYVPLAVIGLVTWRGEHGRRVGLTALSFLSAFCVVGAPFNFYWGLIDGPLLALGVSRAPTVLGGMVRLALCRRTRFGDPGGRLSGRPPVFVDRLAGPTGAR